MTDQAQPYASYVYDSVSDLVARLREPPVNPKNLNYANERWKKTREGWYGPLSNSVQSTVKIALDGWADGYSRVQQNFQKLTLPRIPSVRRRQTWTDQGDYLCHDRLRAGQFDTMWRTPKRRQTSQPPRVRIIGDSGIPFSKNPDCLFWVGATVMVIAESLLEAGYTVEVCAGEAGRYVCEERAQGHPVFFNARTIVKPFNAPWNPNTLAFMVCYPGFFRALTLQADVLDSPHFLARGVSSRRSPIKGEWGKDVQSIVVAETWSQREAQQFLDTFVRDFGKPESQIQVA